MPDYRIYTMSGANRILGPPKIIECKTDQDAIEQAQKLIADLDIEIWQGARCVTRMRPPDAA
jgi:hypothetical protein